MVPTHWTLKRLKQVFKERNQRSVAGDELLLSVSAYTGVSPRSEVVEDGDHLSRADSLEGYKVCKVDDLAVNIMLAWNRGLGVSQYNGIVSPAYAVFAIVDGSRPRFLDFLVRSDRYTLYIKAYSYGVIESRLRIYPDAFRALSCAIPPLPEQDAILAFLNRETAALDDLIKEQQRLVELLKEKRQAIISHAVTKGLNPDAPVKASGIAWLGDVAAHWALLGAKRVSRIFVPQRTKPELNHQSGLRWITMDQMASEDLGSADVWVSTAAARDAGSRVLAAGAVIASCLGRFGIAAINDTDVIINQQLQAFIPGERIRARFLRYIVLVSTAYFEQTGTEATVAYVNQQGFEELPLPIPPLDEQDAIIAFLKRETATLDRLVAAAQRAIDLLLERRAVLISAAVTGQIDVRGLAESDVA